MADEKGKKGKKRDSDRSIIEKIRALITDDPDSDSPTGAGGRSRSRNVMAIVDEAVKGADKDNGVK